MTKKKKLNNEKFFSLEARDFYSDYTDDGLLYASLIRSPAGTGSVSKISIPDLPEDYFIFTAKDIPGQNKVNVNGETFQVFTQGNVSFKGEVLGIVVGPDREKVETFAEDAEISFAIDSLESAFQSVEKKYKHPAINISGKRRPTVADFSSLVAELNQMPSLDTVQNSKRNSRKEEGRTVAERTIKTGLYKSTSVEKAEAELFSEGIKEFSETWELQQADSLWQETSGAFCKMEEDALHVCTPTKWAFLLQDILMQALNLPEDKIYIHKTKTSGMYSNGIWKNAILATQVATASYITKKPVKLVFSQAEETEFMKPGVVSNYFYKTGVTEDGIINSMHLEVEVDVGNANPYAQEIIDRLVIASIGIYKPENLYISAKAVTSNEPPSSIYPRIIDAQSFFALENHMQAMAKEMHLLPDEFRMKNTETNKKDFFISIPVPAINETLSKSIKESDFNRKFFSFNLNANQRNAHYTESFFALPLRGIGFSCAYDGSGYFGKTIFSCDQKMEVTFNSPDDIVIHSMKPSSVVENIWKKTAAEIFQVETSAVKINSEFPAKDIPNMPEETSSNISVMTFLLKKCCLEIQKKRFHSPLPISSKKTLPASIKNKWNNDSFTGIPFHAVSFASVVIELELDSYTYMEKIKGIWMTVCCGELFDKKAAERSLKLAIQQELLTLVENSKLECENIRIFFIQSEESPGQIGELVHNTIPSAFSSALSMALSTRITTVPVSQSLIYDFIKERKIEDIIDDINENSITPEDRNDKIEIKKSEEEEVLKKTKDSPEDLKDANNHDD